MKKNRAYLLLALSFSLNCCSNNKPLTKVPFNLNNLIEEYNPPLITFLKNSQEFNSFLEDESIFTKEPSEKFEEINKKYNNDYFSNKDLAAVITQATSSMIYGYSLNQISKENNYWIISLNELAEKGNVTDDMGAFYCYYFELEKDPNIVGAKLIFE